MRNCLYRGYVRYCGFTIFGVIIVHIDRLARLMQTAHVTSVSGLKGLVSSSIFSRQGEKHMSIVDRIAYHYETVNDVGHPHLLEKCIYRRGLLIDKKYILKKQRLARPVRRACVRVYRNMVKVTQPGKQPQHLFGIKRGLVDLEFGGKPRKRMLDAFNSWRVPNINLVFMHLTYPAEYPLDWRIWKSDLKRFKAALLRKWPNSQGIWKLELQRRGAPHFHIVLDTGKPVAIKRMRQWVDACWARIAHSHDQYQGKYACRVETCWSVRHAANYAGKYMTKRGFNPVDEDGVIITPADIGATMGRLWGKIGKLDCEPEHTFFAPIEALEYYRLQCAKELKRRGARGWFGLANPMFGGSFTVYGFGFASDDRFQPAQKVFDRWDKELWHIGDLKQWLFGNRQIVNAMQFTPSYQPAKG